MNEFVAIDVETANPDLSSICQIGMAYYKNGKLVSEKSLLINPEVYFDGMNVSIHGIDEEDVKDAPNLVSVVNEIYQYLNDRICVCHTHFDRSAITRAFEKYQLTPPQTEWLDSAKVVRRTWQQFSKSGYGLKNICDFLGYSFKHHDALEDAKASAHILQKAIEIKNKSIEEWLVATRHVSPTSKAQLESVSINEGGSFFGEVLVFTGALFIPRREAVDKAASIGCQVDDSVTKRTTILVVGNQDVRRLKPGENKSNKNIKAEKLINKGQAIQVISEKDFLKMIEDDYSLFAA